MSDHIADDVAAYDPDPKPKCDHICLKDDGHVERGEPHFYGYELPSPRVWGCGHVTDEQGNALNVKCVQCYVEWFATAHSDGGDNGA
ncbi:MAG: hypothetical protein ABR532_01530 [Candidatus Dormibacteria bacterium]